MTNRLYYLDSYSTSFSAKVVERVEIEAKHGLILDESFFYPTSGGQPHDVGTLNDIDVIDVLVRGDDHALIHILKHPLDTESVVGEINWARRFDHMQQHTGQHILSRAFEDIVDANTVGFFLSDNTLTIDLDKDDIPQSDLDAVEALANQIIYDNRAVKAWFPSEDELATLPLRKISEKIVGAVRVVDIDGFDVCACGGTHVAHTGEIGMIKILRVEKQKQQTRLEFKCGQRALLDYREKNAILLSTAADLTISYTDIPETVKRLQSENKSLSKTLKGAQSSLMRYEADGLWQESQTEGDLTVLRFIWEDRAIGELQTLMRYLTEKPKTIVLMAVPGEKAHIMFGCSDDANYDVVPLLKSVMETLGTKSGGGRPTLAQSGGFKATRPQLESVMDYAETRARRRE